jgi:hypothetical protein
MRLIAALLLTSILYAPPLFSQTVAETAKEVLTAYKNKDLEGLKKYTAPLVASVMDETVFDDKDVKALQSWDGKVKEVRYFTNEMGLQASAYYDDKDKKTLRALALINAGYGWKQMGVSTVSKKKFLSYETEEPKVKTGAEVKAAPKASGGALPGDMLKEKLGGLGFGFGKKKPKAARKEEPASAAGGYSVEMADGSKADAPDAGRLKKMLGTLSSDNFFITLTGPAGFMQAGYTAKGLDMQYKDASGHFAGVAPVAEETAAAMFKAYLAGEDGWKAQCKWQPFE